MMKQLLVVAMLTLCATFTFAQTQSEYCEREVSHFPADIPESKVKITIANIDANSMYVEIESVDEMDPVSALLIPVLTTPGASLSPENKETPGKISRVISFESTAPENVDMIIQWRKTVNPGPTWQLTQDVTSFPFAATCPFDPPAPPAPPVFCRETVRHFGGNPESEILLTIAKLDDNSMYVEIEGTDVDNPVDLLFFPVVSPMAMVSPENTSNPGKISRVLTWAVPPTEVEILVQWSDGMVGGDGSGRWQLSESPIKVAFETICPFDPPAPPPPPSFCQDPARHFAGNVDSEVLLTIVQSGPNSMYVEVQPSADGEEVTFLEVVVPGSPVMISTPMFNAGRIRRNLEFTSTPPEMFDIIVQWRKANTGAATWLLSETPLSIPFDSQCPDLTPPPNVPTVPTMSEWSLFYFGLLILILGVVFVQHFQFRLQPSVSGTAPQPVRFTLKDIPFDLEGFIGGLKIAFLIAPVAFLFIFLAWGEIVVDDFFGMAIALPMVAYFDLLIEKKIRGIVESFFKS